MCCKVVEVLGEATYSFKSSRALHGWGVSRLFDLWESSRRSRRWVWCERVLSFCGSVCSGSIAVGRGSSVEDDG